jgi:hypothetical protein
MTRDWNNNTVTLSMDDREIILTGLLHAMNMARYEAIGRRDPALCACESLVYWSAVRGLHAAGFGMDSANVQVLAI